MNTTIPTNWIILFGILAVVLLAVAVGFISQRQQQSKRLRQRFGAEYDRAVAELGRTKAEAELRAREKRVEKFTITPLAPSFFSNSSKFRIVSSPLPMKRCPNVLSPDETPP